MKCSSSLEHKMQCYFSKKVSLSIVLSKENIKNEWLIYSINQVKI